MVANRYRKKPRRRGPSAVRLAKAAAHGHQCAVVPPTLQGRVAAVEQLPVFAAGMAGGMASRHKQGTNVCRGEACLVGLESGRLKGNGTCGGSPLPRPPTLAREGGLETREERIAVGGRHWQKLEFMLLHAVQVSACGIRPSTAAPMRRCMPIAQRRATPNFT